MVINSDPEAAPPDDPTDHDRAERRDSRDSHARIRDASQHAGDPPGGTARVAVSRQRRGLPSTSESNYPAPASPDAIAARDRLRIELPRDAPVITPSVARALLRVILAAADRQQIIVEPEPPERTP